jgi:hypothetical protein
LNNELQFVLLLTNCRLDLAPFGSTRKKLWINLNYREIAGFLIEMQFKLKARKAAKEAASCPLDRFPTL